MSTTNRIELLNDCGCCEGQTASTPARIENRPGLDTISYRIGDYHRFRETMLARLSSSDLPSLKRLTTRDQDDYSIALIDAWASVAEVLSFYQEYFANEGLLRTAKERLSVLEHARLIGYQLNPGVAASAYLAFTMDEPLANMDNPILETIVPAGSQVQSTPGPDETAQIFETEVEIEARVAWNAIRPRLTQPQLIDVSMQSVLVDGISTFVKPGDDLLFVDQSNAEEIKQVLDVDVDEENETTQIILSGDLSSPSTYSVQPKDTSGSFSLFDAKVTVDDSVIDIFINHSWAIEDIVAIADTKHWSLKEIAQRINTHSDVTKDVATGKGVYGFHKRANFFGFNAQKKVVYEDSYPYKPKDISDWIDWTASESDQTIYLDNDYPEITPGSYCIVRDNSDSVFQIQAVKTVSRTAYGISSKSSKLTLKTGDQWFSSTTNLMANTIREAAILAQSEALPLVQVPLTEPVKGETILLEHADLNIRNGQYMAITGERVDQPGVMISEVLQIDEARLEHGFTEITFANSLDYEYIRNSVTLNANVAPASHGESVSEVLGSGDASTPSQQFSLKQTPLSYLAADVPGGAKSTLEIRVNDILWEEVETFLYRQSEERIYTTKLDDAGVTHVYFGNGIEGARLPSGTNNVVARYRRGIGLGGLVNEKQLNLLLTRPLGIKEAINPEKSSGADDPEKLVDARTNAPLGLLTLGRTVSLSDYEDFCRAFAGIAKARAVAVSEHGVPKIYITISGPEGEIVDDSSKTYEKLLAALENAGDPYTQFSILPYRPAYFKLDAGLYVDADYQDDLVLEAAHATLRENFSFDSRAFNQPIHLSEVIAVLQRVEGVIAVDVNHLYRSDASPVSPLPRSIMPNLTNGSSTSDDVLGAELITLDPAPLDQVGVKK